MARLFFVFITVIFFLVLKPIFASPNSYVSIVNPIRGEDFWDGDERLQEAIIGQIEILKKYDLTSSWLLRFDALTNAEILETINQVPQSHEKGLFLEITPSWAKAAGVVYNTSPSWHFAESVFLTGYPQEDRIKLIDVAFERFKATFGFYPKSVGAWWIDSYSLEYMQKKYGIVTGLIVSDQYSTDNYQIWGQYFGTPYYPAKKNALNPAQNVQNKIPVVMVQWAARDPVNGYGKGVEESTLSVQANDYLDYHKLDTDYFGKLVDIYTKQTNNQFNHLVVGLENSYSWEKYKGEYQRQIKLLKSKTDQGQFQLLTLRDFAHWYKNKFPDISPPQVIISNDPLNTAKKSVWFMNPYYRVGWFFNEEGSVVRDIRQYLDGSEEICYQEQCSKLNFATNATRVLDDVTYHKRWVLDRGDISDFSVIKKGEDYLLSYKNAAGVKRELEFLKKDISFDGKISTIDGLILDVTSKELSKVRTNGENFNSLIPLNIQAIFNGFWQIFLFGIFLISTIYIPGLILTRKIRKEITLDEVNIFLAIVSGMVILTNIGFIIGLLKIWWLIYLYVVLVFFIFIKQRLYKLKFQLNLNINKLIYLLIILGTIFQILPVFRSGLNFEYGVGFWGPNAHDGVWHMSLINQLVNKIPPENPVYGGVTLQNYHYFFDLLVAITFKLTNIPLSNLLFRIYPIIFSLLLGLGSWSLSRILFNSKLVSLFSLYLVYFAGSFGYIVSIIKKEEWAGESAFWANQAVSFNLNLPFAISLLILLAIILILKFRLRSKFSYLILIILSGTLVSFKAYGAVLLILAFFILTIFQLKKKILDFLYLFVGMGIVSLLVLLPQYRLDVLTKSGLGSLFVFSPFWFIHSMIDNPDRVGWFKLSAAREAYFQRKEWFKLGFVEALGFLVFLLGNLGMRFLGLLAFLKKPKENFDLHLMIFIISLFSLLTPVLFIQTGTPWNTIQFLYYGMFFASFYASYILAAFFRNLPIVLGVVVVLVVLIITPISSLTTAKGYLYPKPHAFVSKGELEALNFLKVQPVGLILTYPFEKELKKVAEEPYPLYAYDTTSYVSAFSKMPTFVEDEIQNQILQTDYIKRLLISGEIFSSRKDYAKNYLRDENIRYVYLPKIFKTSLREDELGIKKIFDNKEVIIYEVDR